MVKAILISRLISSQTAHTHTKFIMKLTHLGASYTPSTQTIETFETDTKLSFLGRMFKMRAPVATPAHPAGHSLTYRGIRYNA